MITPEIFNRNEVLRSKLAASLDVLELAFAAADYAEDVEINARTHDALLYSMLHAERTAIVRYKARIRLLTQVPSESVGPLEASYAGIDPYDQIRIDAEAEHAKTVTVKSKDKGSQNT